MEFRKDDYIFQILGLLSRPSLFSAPILDFLGLTYSLGMSNSPIVFVSPHLEIFF